MSYEIFDPRRGQRVPIFMWRRDPAPDTIAQLLAIASQPYIVDHIAAMADAHVSDGVAVGTVFATERTIVPAALGGDLGCGVAAVRFDCPAAAFDRRMLERVVEQLGRVIPVGAGVHRGRGVDVPNSLLAEELSTHALEKTRRMLMPKHLATLGGGNHFLELDRGADGGLWLLVHSGSRGLGAAIAAHHRRAAGTSVSEPLADSMSSPLRAQPTSRCGVGAPVRAREPVGDSGARHRGCGECCRGRSRKRTDCRRASQLCRPRAPRWSQYLGASQRGHRVAHGQRRD